MHLSEDRRALHKLAEVGEYLPKTQEYIVNRIKNLGCVLEFPFQSAVTAFFDFGFESTIALRADMDALPIHENAKCDFASETPGTMHACGHDGHMAMLLGVADLLGEKRIKPHSNVLLIFQPAEETSGGAKPIIDSGILEQYNVKRVFGTHLIPELAKNSINIRKGPQMAQSNEVTVDIHGRSLHIVRHAEGIDALDAGAKFLSRLYEKVEGTGIEYKILRFGKMESGTVRNALSAHTHIEGTLRSFSEEDHKTLTSILYGTAREIDEEFGTKTTVFLNEGHPPVYNDPELVEELEKLLNVTELGEPFMIADDFSWYQTKVPGVYIFLGTGTGIPLHSPDYVLDESVLETGVDYYKKIIENL